MRFRCRNKKSIDPEKVNVLAKALIDNFSFYTCGQELPTLLPVMEDNHRLDICRKKDRYSGRPIFSRKSVSFKSFGRKLKFLCLN